MPLSRTKLTSAHRMAAIDSNTSVQEVTSHKTPGPSVYSQLLNHEYLPDGQVSIPEEGKEVTQLCLVNQCIWIYYDREILILNSNFEYLNSLNTKQPQGGLGYIKALLHNPRAGHVIAVYDKEIYQYSDKPPHDCTRLYKYEISTNTNSSTFSLMADYPNVGGEELDKYATFIDVCITHQLYILSSTGRHSLIHICSHTGGGYKLHSTINEPHMPRGSRISVDESNIYIYCLQAQGEHWIKVYNHKKTLLQQLGVAGYNQPGELINARLCGVEGSGNLLVSDIGNHRLQVYTRERGWGIVNIRARLHKVWLVLTGNDDKYIWVCSYEEHEPFNNTYKKPKLARYKKSKVT